MKKASRNLVSGSGEEPAIFFGQVGRPAVPCASALAVTSEVKTVTTLDIYLQYPSLCFELPKRTLGITQLALA